jgi:hypothetical protein
MSARAGDNANVDAAIAAANASRTHTLVIMTPTLNYCGHDVARNVCL